MSKAEFQVVVSRLPHQLHLSVQALKHRELKVHYNSSDKPFAQGTILNFSMTTE